MNKENKIRRLSLLVTRQEEIIFQLRTYVNKLIKQKGFYCEDLPEPFVLLPDFQILR